MKKQKKLGTKKPLEKYLRKLHKSQKAMQDLAERNRDFFTKKLDDSPVEVLRDFVIHSNLLLKRALDRVNELGWKLEEFNESFDIALDALYDELEINLEYRSKILEELLDEKE